MEMEMEWQRRARDREGGDSSHTLVGCAGRTSARMAVLVQLSGSASEVSYTQTAFEFGHTASSVRSRKET